MSTDDANGLFHDALLGNRVGFIKLLLEYSYVNIQNFMTNERLKDLYMGGVEEDFGKHRGKSAGSFFYQIVSRKMCKGTSVGADDKQILNNWKEQLFGHYNEKEWRTHDPLIFEIPLFHKISQCERQLIDTDWSSIYHRRVNNYSHKYGSCLYPQRDLFLWCLLFRRVEMAKAIWSTSNDGLVSALAAAALCRNGAMLDNRDTDVHDKFIADAQEYESAALGIFLEAHSRDRSKAFKLLTRVSDAWGNRTCLEVAIAGKCRNFMSHVSVQELLTMIWRGNIHIDQNYGEILLCLALPIIPILPSKIIRFDNTENKVSWKRKFLWIYQAPVSVFFCNVFFYILFLSLFGFVITAKFCIQPHWTECLLIFWTVTLIFEEIRQILQEPGTQKLRSWWSDLYNNFDFLGYILFMAGIVLKIMTYFKVKAEGGHDIIEPEHHCPLVFDNNYLYASHILYCLSFITLTIRIMDFYSNSRRLGPKVLMVTSMFMDMIQFLAIMVIFVLSYGIAVQGILYPNEWRVGKILYNIIYTPYFQVYGELFIGELTTYAFEDHLDPEKGECSNLPFRSHINETSGHDPYDPQRCPNPNKMVEVLQAFYILISNVLLLNLLVALFSNTFEEIQEHSEKYWKFQRYSLIREYYQRPAFVPPFIILSHLNSIGRYLGSKCWGKYKGHKVQEWYNKHNNETNIYLTATRGP